MEDSWTAPRVKTAAGGCADQLRQRKNRAHIAQKVERVLGKNEVSSSNLLVGSIVEDF